MHPRLLTTPFFTIHTFGVLLASAYLAFNGTPRADLLARGRLDVVDSMREACGYFRFQR